MENILPDAQKPPVKPQLPFRERLWLASGKQCHWCGCETLYGTATVPNQATIDHVIPRCRGGANTPDNCVSACSACNGRRNREDQAQPDHPNNQLSAKERLRRSREEASARAREREQVRMLSATVKALECLSPWSFFLWKLQRAIRSKLPRPLGA